MLGFVRFTVMWAGRTAVVCVLARATHEPRNHNVPGCTGILALVRGLGYKETEVAKSHHARSLFRRMWCLSSPPSPPYAPPRMYLLPKAPNE